jgi:hypothetical protein
MTACYALDIGIYTLRRDGAPTAGSSAAWACALAGCEDFAAIRHGGTRGQHELAIGGTQVARSGRSIPQLAERIGEDLLSPGGVALGFEAPMWLPIRRGSLGARERLFAPRFDAEGGREWYLQSGAAASLKAIALGVMLLSAVLETHPCIRLSTAAEDASAGSIVFYCQRRARTAHLWRPALTGSAWARAGKRLLGATNRHIYA